MQVTAKEAPNPNLPMLVFLVCLQVLYICPIYGPIAAYLVEAFPARIRYTSLSPAISRRQRRVRRTASGNRSLGLRSHGQHLRRTLLSNDRVRSDADRGKFIAEGVAYLKLTAESLASIDRLPNEC